MRQQAEAEEASRSARAQEVERSLTLGAQAAQGFIELMRKHSVEPETVYRHEQVRRPFSLARRIFGRPTRYGYHTTTEQFEVVARGWVVEYSIDEYNHPWLISYLMPDGMMADCQWRPFGSEFPNVGIVKPPARTALGTSGALIVPPFDFRKPRRPSLTVDDYAKAARTYLS